jgi:hypothetical protein
LESSIVAKLERKVNYGVLLHLRGSLSPWWKKKEKVTSYFWGSGGDLWTLM